MSRGSVMIDRARRFRDYPRAIQVRKFRTRLVGAIAGRLYVDLNHDVASSLMISGTPRSGTTWLADLLLQNLKYRLIFAPIRHGAEGLGQYESRYVPEGELDENLYRRFHELLSGTKRDRRLDERNPRLLARGRLVKCVSANLLLGWFQEQFPSVPIVYIVRHPLLVVSSYMQMSWLTPKEATHWLRQEQLMADHLAPFQRLIESTSSPLQRSALDWCVLNYVPQQQHHSEKWFEVKYEDLVRDPETVLKDLFSGLGMWKEGMRWRRFYVPSSTAESSVSDRAALISKWTTVLSDDDRATVERYVREFGLDTYLDP